MATVLLFGDSMVGRFTKPHIQHLERELGSGVTVQNAAAGGWDSSDCARRASVLARIGPDVVVLSLGANDCAPWKQVALPAFAENVAQIRQAFDRSSVVAFLPPRIVEVEQPGVGRRSNATLDAYRDVLRETLGVARSFDVATLLEPVSNFAVLEPDGLHLTDESYTFLMPELARVVAKGLTESTTRR